MANQAEKWASQTSLFLFQYRSTRKSHFGQQHELKKRLQGKQSFGCLWAPTSQVTGNTIKCRRKDTFYGSKAFNLLGLF